MKPIQSRALAIGAVLLLCVAALFAQGGRGGPDHEFGHMLGFYSDALGLSSAQQDQIKAIWQQEKTTLKPLMQQMHQNRQAMDALAESGSFDANKATALATQNAQTTIQLEVEHAKMKSEMLQVLTPDQKTKYQQMEANREARMQKHMSSEPPSE